MAYMDRITELTEMAAEQFNVPSVSVSVVCGGEISEVSKGCTGSTVFQIGTVSKTFLSAALADTGMDMDCPVRKYSPWFFMKDNDLSDRVTVRDILLQRTGLPEHRISWFIRPELTFREISEMPRYLETAYGFRKRNARQDHLFAAASRTLEDVTGMDWAGYISSRILEPAGIRTVFFSREDMDNQGYSDAAVPHYLSYGTVTEGTAWITDLLAGGGSMLCGTTALAGWAERCRISGKTETVSVPDDCFGFPSAAVGMKRTEAGNGWYRTEFLGSGLMFAAGSVGGSGVFCGWLEDSPFAFAAAADLNGAPCAEAICLSLCEMQVRGSVSDWNSRLGELHSAVARNERRRNSILLRECTDEVFSARLTGLYGNEAYGELYIYEEYGRLFTELFGVPMRIYRTEGDLCVLDATEILGKAVPCTVSEDAAGFLFEPSTGRMTEFKRIG